MATEKKVKPDPDRPGKTPSTRKLRTMQCDQESPRLEPTGDTRNGIVRCNRPGGHDGAHRNIRARDFKIMDQWDGHIYTILRGNRVADSGVS